jgi:hypothetical protein
VGGFLREGGEEKVEATARRMEDVSPFSLFPEFRNKYKCSYIHLI